MPLPTPAAPNERDEFLEPLPLLLTWRTDRHGACDFLSEGWLAFTGRAFDDAMGEGWLRSIHADDRELVITTHRAAHRRQGPFELAFRLRRNDFTYRLVLDRGTPRFDLEGTFQGLVGSMVDITGHLDAISRATHSRATRGAETTVCTACNKVHAGDGTWQRLEAWVAQRFDAALARGLCPDCESRWERGA